MEFSVQHSGLLQRRGATAGIEFLQEESPFSRGNKNFGIHYSTPTIPSHEELASFFQQMMAAESDNKKLSLKHVQFNPNLDDGTWVLFVEFISMCPDLQKISFENCKFTPAQWGVLFLDGLMRRDANCPVRTLRIAGCPHPTIAYSFYEGLTLLAHDLSHCPKKIILEKLESLHENLEDVSQLFEWLLAVENLPSFNIEALNIFVEFLHDSKMADQAFLDSGLSPTRENIENFEPIKVLREKYNGTAHPFIFFLQALSNSPTKIESLHLIDLKIDDASFYSLMILLERMQTLSSVDISNNCITADGIERWAQRVLEGEKIWKSWSFDHNSDQFYISREDAIVVATQIRDKVKCVHLPMVKGVSLGEKNLFCLDIQGIMASFSNCRLIDEILEEDPSEIDSVFSMATAPHASLAAKLIAFQLLPRVDTYDRSDIEKLDVIYRALFNHVSDELTEFVGKNAISDALIQASEFFGADTEFVRGLYMSMGYLNQDMIASIQEFMPVVFYTPENASSWVISNNCLWPSQSEIPPLEEGFYAHIMQLPGGDCLFTLREASPIIDETDLSELPKWSLHEEPKIFQEVAEHLANIPTLQEAFNYVMETFFDMKAENVNKYGISLSIITDIATTILSKSYECAYVRKDENSLVDYIFEAALTDYSRDEIIVDFLKYMLEKKSFESENDAKRLAFSLQYNKSINGEGLKKFRQFVSDRYGIQMMIYYPKELPFYKLLEDGMLIPPEHDYVAGRKTIIIAQDISNTFFILKLRKSAETSD